MKKNLMKKMSFLLVLMLVAAMTFGCGTKTNDTTAENTAAQTEVTEASEAADTEAAAETTEAADNTEAEVVREQVGEGSTTFYFDVTDGEGNSTYYEVATDETTVGAALLALGMIEGEDSEYGLYVKTVNGVTADYDKDGTYWAFYIDGEYASTGVDATDITPGATYAFVVEKG